MIQTINAAEHRPFSFLPEMAGWYEDVKSNATTKETLGLHKTPQGVAPGNFIGAVYIGEGESRAVLCSHPKREFENMDYLSMFLHCAAHREVGERMGNCLHFWPEQPSIDTDKAAEFCGLTAAAYLRELHELCARHFRRHFTRETANFAGKVKGRILTAENIRRNIARLRGDRVFCAFQSVSDDIAENRILRAALERAAVFIANNEVYDDAVLREWIGAGRAALRGVSVARIFPSDHRSARVRGAFSHYRRPLRLARAVLESSGFDLDDKSRAGSGVSPFALNSAELFERWAELKLLEEYPSRLQAGLNDISAHPDGVVRIRPDFWIASSDGNPAMILDAKYKSAPDGVRAILDDNGRSDIYQMVAYSRHRNFLQDKLRADALAKVHLALLYPRVDGERTAIEKSTPDRSFHSPLSVWKIPCPAKREMAAKAAESIAA